MLESDAKIDDHQPHNRQHQLLPIPHFTRADWVPTVLTGVRPAVMACDARVIESGDCSPKLISNVRQTVYFGIVIETRITISK